MSFIQRFLANTVKILAMALAISGMVQPDQTTWISLTPEKVPLAKGQSFYVSEVRDARAGKPAAFGSIIEGSANRPVALQGTLTTALEKFWSASAPRSKADQIPLVITLNRYLLSESRAGAGKINGKFDFQLSLSWVRDGVPVKLTDIQAAVTYSRGTGPYNHAQLVQKITADALRNIDKWFVTNDGKNQNLVRKLELRFPEIDFRETDDTVFYSPDRKLTWSDFQARPSSKGVYAATVFTSFGYTGGSRVRNNILEVDITVKIYVVKNMSWVRPDAKNAYTLGHEQLHFDIVRIMTENFKERLRKAELTIEDYDSEIQYQFIEAYRDLHDEQKKYDDETSHGLNKGAQAEWQLRVNRKLATFRQGS